MVLVGLVNLVVGPGARVASMVNDRNGRGMKVIVRLAHAGRESVRIVRGKMVIVRHDRVVNLGSARNEHGEMIDRVVHVVQKVSVRRVRGMKVIGRLVHAGTESVRIGRDKMMIVRLVHVGKQLMGRFVVAVNPASVDPIVELVVVRAQSVPVSVAHGETVSDRNGRGETVIGRLVRGEILIANVAPSAPSPMHNVEPMKCAAPKVVASSSAVRFPMSDRRKSVGSTKGRYVHRVSRAPKRASRNDRVQGRFRRPSTLARLVRSLPRSVNVKGCVRLAA